MTLFNMHPEEIKLRSRYGNWYILEKIEGNLYKFRERPPYTRIGWDPETHEICFIDPPGGPFITIGTMIDNYKVQEFDNNGNIYLQ